MPFVIKGVMTFYDHDKQGYVPDTCYVRSIIVHRGTDDQAEYVVGWNVNKSMARRWSRPPVASLERVRAAQPDANAEIMEVSE